MGRLSFKHSYLRCDNGVNLQLGIRSFSASQQKAQLLFLIALHHQNLHLDAQPPEGTDAILFQRRVKENAAGERGRQPVWICIWGFMHLTNLNNPWALPVTSILHWGSFLSLYHAPRLKNGNSKQIQMSPNETLKNSYTKSTDEKQSGDDKA